MPDLGTARLGGVCARPAIAALETPVAAGGCDHRRPRHSLRDAHSGSVAAASGIQSVGRDDLGHHRAAEFSATACLGLAASRPTILRRPGEALEMQKTTGRALPVVLEVQHKGGVLSSTGLRPNGSAAYREDNTRFSLVSHVI